MLSASAPAPASAFDMEICPSPSTTSDDSSLPASKDGHQSGAWSESWNKFGLGFSADDEHVTVWEPSTGKTVAGNAAPYRKNLNAWLINHPGWEEKADELKSSKRRSAARRAKTAHKHFADLCKYTPMCLKMATDMNRKVEHMATSNGKSTSTADQRPLSSDMSLRMEEAFIDMARSVHACEGGIERLGTDRWLNFARSVDAKKDAFEILLHAHDLLLQRRDALCPPQPISIGSPVSPFSELSMSFPGEPVKPKPTQDDVPSFLTKPFRTHREPRVTVWHPATGRTVSGNAAPCRRNLDSWIKAHPGWEPKAEDKLSSSRRKKSTRRRSKGNFVTCADKTAADALIMFQEKVVDHMDSDCMSSAESYDSDDMSMCDSSDSEGEFVFARPGDSEDYDMAF